MKDRAVSIGIVLLLILGGFIGLISFEPEVVVASSGNTLYVGGTGAGNYSSIQAAIDAANSGDTVFVFDDNAPYNEDVEVYKSLTLIGENRDTTIIDANYYVFNVTANNVVISNFTLKNGYYGIWLKQSINNKIANNRFINNGIYIEKKYLSDYYSQDIASNNIVNNKPLLYYKNTSNINLISVPVGQLFLINCTNVNIQNIIINKTTIGMDIIESKNINIAFSSVDSNKNDGISFRSSSNVNFTNNNVSFNKGCGMDISESHDFDIRNNNIQSNSFGGLIIYSSTGFNIINNSVIDNKYGSGIYLYYSSNHNNITNNEVTMNAEGIIIGSSKNNSIENNSINSNYLHGIEIFSWSKYNNIENNTITNSRFGISLLASSHYNIIKRNIIKSNGNGTFVSYSSGNKIYYNSFLDNFYHQAYNSDSTNYWNLTYPCGGNYWDDYTGVDQFSGPNQDQPGSDGIGDTPYTFVYSTQDVYPLMSPVTSIPENKGTLSGYVRDPQSNPIPGARVKVSFHGTYEDDYTDPNGYYYVSNIPICYCLKNVTVTKSGYVSTWIETGIVENMVYDFTLKPIINVHNIDTGEYFETIQGAIDDGDTKDGHTIMVANGTYFENVYIGKAIDLVGENSSTTIIDGMGKGDVINITVNNVEVRGFKIINSEYPYYGIRIEGIDNCYISDCFCTNNSYSIVVKSSEHNFVANNACYNNSMGICVWQSNNNWVYNNICEYNNQQGLYVASSNSNTIDSNICRYNSYGIYTTSGYWNKFSNNTMTSNEYDGLSLWFCQYNEIKDNICDSNSDYGIFLGFGFKNRIYHNNIINNKNQSFDNTAANFWNASYPTGGNYWSDYSGFDEFSSPNQDQFGSDGIGDTPYTNIPGEEDVKDNYPFINPNGWLPVEPGVLWGYVYDQDWNPLPDARVRVEFHGTYKEDYTDSNGYYRVTNIQICYCLKNVSVSREGFESQWTYLGIGENTFLEFLLNRSKTILNIDTGKYYDAIQEALDDEYTLDGHTITVDNGIYFENLNINKSINLIGENRNKTIIDGGMNEEVINVSANWVNISGFTIRNKEYYVSGVGIKLNSAQNCYISDNNILTYWDALRLSLSHNNIIKNNFLSLDFYPYNRYCVSLKYSCNNIIKNNIISNSSQGIYLQFSDNNSIFNNFILNNTGGVGLYKSSNNTISYNVASNSWYYIDIWKSFNTTVENNVMTGGGIYIEGDLLEHWNTHTINDINIVNGKPVYYWKNTRDNTIPSDAGQVILANCTNIIIEHQNLSGLITGITIGFSSWNSIINNSVFNFSWCGIGLFYSCNNIISNNNALSNNYAIRLEFSNDNIITSNFISDNEDGIYLGNSSNNIITNNNVLNNNNGFHIGALSNNNIIKNNDISLTQYDAVDIREASNNIFIENNIFNNNRGVYINPYAINNRFFHNNFINNSVQAYDAYDPGLSNLNHWNDSYPTGGNYWSDYNGTDANGDGFGDTPYDIDAYNQDHYPLMKPWEPPSQEFENITVIIDLTKPEFNFRETISGSIHITNDNPFVIALNDQPFQMLTGAFFKIISMENINEFGTVYNYYPIEVQAQSTLTINFELNEVYTLPMDSKELNYVHLPVGNYSIHSYFFYGNHSIETINSNSVNFRIFDTLQPIADGNGNHESDEFRQTLIITSTASLIILIIILTLFISGTEIGKYKFFVTFAAPLYSRELKKRKKGYKDGYLRGKVHGYILGNPGEAYNTIKRKLGLNNGALAYHLKVLEREHEIRAERDGLYKRFYPYEGKITAEILELSKLQRRLYNQIKLKPGMTQKQVSERLKIPTQKVNYHIKLLVGARVIRLEREGNRTICYVIEDVG